MTRCPISRSAGRVEWLNGGLIRWAGDYGTDHQVLSAAGKLKLWVLFASLVEHRQRPPLFTYPPPSTEPGFFFLTQLLLRRATKAAHPSHRIASREDHHSFSSSSSITTLLACVSSIALGQLYCGASLLLWTEPVLGRHCCCSCDTLRLCFSPLEQSLPVAWVSLRIRIRPRTSNSGSSRSFYFIFCSNSDQEKCLHHIRVGRRAPNPDTRQLRDLDPHPASRHESTLHHPPTTTST